MNTGKREGLVRDSDAAGNLELLLVIAVATILVNRAFLSLTHYPRIAFGHFHIAHMLWGGLLMLVSLIMTFHYWNPSVRRSAAFISGIGFGLFIDELGKFITKDNDYFFQPTIAIIYIIFVALYLIFRRMARNSGPMDQQELEFNAIIRDNLPRLSPNRWLSAYYTVRSSIRHALKRFLTAPRVVPIIMILFILKSVMQFAAVLGMIDPNWVPFESLSGISLAGATASSILVIVGLVAMGRNRLAGVHWFKRAILLNIFVTQVFLFYQSQLTAIWGLGVDLLVYASIEFFIRSCSE